MPCPAMELGANRAICCVVEISKTKATAKHLKHECVGWRGITCSAFGHGMPFPY